MIRAATAFCLVLCLLSARLPAQQADLNPPKPTPADEAALFTPQGFDKPGLPKLADGTDVGTLKLNISDASTSKKTFCRVNVVGPDGNYYQPSQNYLTKYNLVGTWPKTGWGNRDGKGPFRYYGRFFYSWGESTLSVPPGKVRVEVWKGNEYHAEVREVTIATGKTTDLNIILKNSLDLPARGYFSGDSHLHFDRASDADDQLVLDLLEAEDVHYGMILAYNEPAGPYAGIMSTLASPQDRGLGKKSTRIRDSYAITSGQEYRSGTYGHLNLYQRDGLVLPNEKRDANNWPLYGNLARETINAGGYAWYAHGGYSQAIYADFVQGNVSAVELLQFGHYRGINLTDWYHILNLGYRLPIIGASDFPACRKLADCLTYVHLDKNRDMSDWLAGAAAGKSFVSTGPAILFEAEGKRPGDEIILKSSEPEKVKVLIRVRCEVAPVSQIQLIHNGKVVLNHKVSAELQQGEWVEFPVEISVASSGWIAVRAYSTTANNLPDAEAHTNPIYIIKQGRAPYVRDSLDALLAKLDGQIALHRKRNFAEKAQVLTYFERSRDILLRMRAEGGYLAKDKPWVLWEDKAKAEFDPGQLHQSEEQLREFLKPVPALSLEKAKAAIEIRPGFHLETVAAEPDVVDPVAAAIDENGLMYVAELRDYPYFPKPGEKPLGTIRLLRDTNGDGKYDRSTVFADELLWAAGIAPWKGGVYVTAPPDIWYMKDTDGDDKADVKRKIFTGFGTQNQQAMLNNLKFGLDHNIYGSTAHNGGEIRKVADQGSKPASFKGRDFRFSPNVENLEPVTGTVQFGNTFDDWGHRFLCSQGTALIQVMLPQHYLARNPALTAAQALHTISPNDTPIYRISQVERWRAIRSARRVAFSDRNAAGVGVSHHVLDAGAGVTIYRGGAFPPEFHGDAFIGDAQNNLIHRMKLHRAGETFKYERPEKETEFARSSDTWFRPVNFLNAPDGTLYALDMSREIIESIHIPSDIVKFLDLKNGRTTGRIYRITPDGFQSPAPPKLGAATSAELVSHLESPHGWSRDTAHRLLYERQDKSVVPALRTLLTVSIKPESRLHALWSLAGLDSLTTEDLLHALSDPHFSPRIHALQLSEPRFDNTPELVTKALTLAQDPDPEVRFQLAFSLGEMHDPRVPEILLVMLRKESKDQWIRTALLSSVTPHALLLSELILKNEIQAATPEMRAILDQLAQAISLKSSPQDFRQYLALLAALHVQQPQRAEELLLTLGRGLNQQNKTLTASSRSNDAGENFVTATLEQARRKLKDHTQPEPARLHALQLLACGDYNLAGEALAACLTPEEPPALQSEAIRALGLHSEPVISDTLLKAWRALTPDLKKQAVGVLLSRTPWTQAYLTAAKEDASLLSLLDQNQRDYLHKHNSPQIKSEAEKLLGQSALGGRNEVIEKYQPALKLKGLAASGAKIFERECAGCHKMGNVGVATGPNLASSAAREPAALLKNVLNPNLNVQPEFIQYVIVDKSGRTTQGMIASQSPNSIVLKRERDATETILRSNIEEMVSTGKSLMPEGLEQKISPQEMADLIAFLQQAQAAAPAAPPKLEPGTEPGLVEP